MSNPVNVALLSHEVFHVFQREQAGKTDPNRATDFTQKRMEIEAYQFQYVIQAELAKATNNDSLLIDAKFFLKRFSGSYSDAESELLTRNIYDDTYINAPEGKGGTLDYSGLPSWLIPYALTLKISQPTPTPTSTPSQTPTPIPSSTPTPTPTDTSTPTPPTFTPKAP